MLKPKGDVRKHGSRAPARSKIVEARRLYLSGVLPARDGMPEIQEPSLVDVAAYVGISISTIQKRSREEGWVTKRKEAQEMAMVAAQKALEAENARLVSQMAGQHAKSRVAMFRSAMLLQATTERRLRSDGMDLPMKDLASAGTALARAQAVADTAVIGPKTDGDTAVAVQVNVGWTGLQAPGAAVAAHLQAFEE